MWEWSGRILKKTSPASAKSLLAAYNDLLLQTAPATPHIVKDQDIAADDRTSLLPPAPPQMRQYLLTHLADFGFSRMTLRECSYDPQNWQEMDKSWTEYLRIREIFLKLLGYSHADECLKAGLDKNDIKLLRGSIAPENYDIHMKIPFDFGGTLSFDNLCLIQTHPRHDLIHRLIDLQIENNYLRTHKKIWLPWFDGKIYHD